MNANDSYTAQLVFDATHYDDIEVVVTVTGDNDGAEFFAGRIFALSQDEVLDRARVFLVNAGWLTVSDEEDTDTGAEATVERITDL